MSKFKVGDRVRLTGNINGIPRGAEGRVTEADRGITYDHRVLFPGYQHLNDHASGVLLDADELEPVEPRKDTPNIGDTVRVVLEGKVRKTAPGTLALVAGNLDQHSLDATVWHTDDNPSLKSIEIITPARPSVADLPVGSVISYDESALMGDDAYLKVDPENWVTTGTRGSTFHESKMLDGFAVWYNPKDSES